MHFNTEKLLLELFISFFETLFKLKMDAQHGKILHTLPKMSKTFTLKTHALGRLGSSSTSAEAIRKEVQGSCSSWPRFQSWTSWNLEPLEPFLHIIPSLRGSFSVYVLVS